MYKSITLKLKITSLWHIGTGKEAGAYADSLTLKDADGLPYLSGKSLKGLLKDAMQQAEDNHWFTQGTVKTLFGFASDEESSQGKIFVSNAELSTGERAFFQQNASAKSHLFEVLTSTALDAISGVAKEGSLRSIEVSVPMELIASVQIDDGESQQFLAHLKSCLPLITHLGGKRHRGLGEVFIELGED